MAQGSDKLLSYKKQVAKGTAASGSGGQYLRRETATFSKKKDTYSANEITAHKQHTGDKHGVGRSDGTLNGVLSGGTYKDMLASLLRKDMTATSAISSLTLTIAGSGPYTVTRSTGDFLADGVKIFDVVRLSGANLAAGNVALNLLVTGVTATILTVITLNGATMTAESGKTASTVTVTGKKTRAPISSHTNDYYTFEEWYSDISKSHTWPDTQVAKADIAFPATGNATINLTYMGLGGRTKGASQVLTSPTAETSSEIYAAVNGVLLVNGTQYATITAASLSIDSGMTAGEAVLGSNTISDNQRGTLKVTGSISGLYETDTISDLFDSEAAISLCLVATENDDNDAEFVTFAMSRVKVFGDDADDGKKQIIRTYPFTAEINGAGGTALANDQTTITHQDSLA